MHLRLGHRVMYTIRYMRHVYPDKKEEKGGEDLLASMEIESLFAFHILMVYLRLYTSRPKAHKK